MVARRMILTWPDGHVLLSWGDSRAGQRDVWSRVSSDGGRSWEPVQRVDTGDPPGATASGGPQLVHGGPGKEVAALWTDLRDGTPRLYRSYSSDGGRTWDAPLALSAYDPDGLVQTFGAVGHPDESWLTAAWTQRGRDWQVRCGFINCPGAWYATSCDGGRTWEPDTQFLGLPEEVNWVDVLAYPAAAAGAVYAASTVPLIHHVRFDGPTLVRPAGPAVYCVGKDPLLGADVVSAACQGGLSLQWYVDGVAVPGAVNPTWQPAFNAGQYLVEVRGECRSNPTCMPAWIGTTLRAVAPLPPPDVGNALRAARGPSSVSLDWTRAPSAPDAHSHLRRSFAKGAPWSLVSPDPLVLREHADVPPVVEPLVFYDVRLADPCEVESAN
jgi:hypothetical protein